MSKWSYKCKNRSVLSLVILLRVKNALTRKRFISYCHQTGSLSTDFMQRTYVSSALYKENFTKVAIIWTSIAAKKKKKAWGYYFNWQRLSRLRSSHIRRVGITDDREFKKQRRGNWKSCRSRIQWANEISSMRVHIAVKSPLK